MSTKIYNAYRFDGPIDDLMAHLYDFRKQWLELQTKRFFEMVKDLSHEEREKTLQQIEDDTRKQYNRWGDLDIKGSCVVYFNKGKIYTQFFIDLVPFKISIPLFVSEDKRFQDFHYQNQTDPWYCEMEDDETKSAELEAAKQDWQVREQVWDEIYSRGYSPVACGLTYNFGNVFDVYRIRLDIATKIRELNRQST